MQNLYSVLRVAPKASDAEIKSAFRNLAKTCHPDVRPGDPEAEQIFQEAKRAYTFLSNPETRKLYDSFLADRRAAARMRMRRSVTTMSTTFMLTAATVLLAMMWLQEGSIAVGGRRLFAGAPERATLEFARASAATPSGDDQTGAGRAPAAPPVRETPNEP